MQAAMSMSPNAATLLTNRLIEGHIGQGVDLHWANQTKIPTEEEYFTMIDGKTGGLFVLVAELMHSEATENKDLDAKALMKNIGRFLHVRDDYLNLRDADPGQCSKKFGLAEDLNQGRISLPLIHALSRRGHHRGRLLNILQQRKLGNFLSPELQKLASDDITAAGGLEYTRGVILCLQNTLDESLTHTEEKAGSNWILRLMKKRLEL
ncbi:unnamed protein product [Penicillium olsonii]|nr:unnamed protein product [Penicillium olsonii]